VSKYTAKVLPNMSILAAYVGSKIHEFHFIRCTSLKHWNFSLSPFSNTSHPYTMSEFEGFVDSILRITEFVDPFHCVVFQTEHKVWNLDLFVF
jgi:hypothetical protein